MAGIRLSSSCGAREPKHTQLRGDGAVSPALCRGLIGRTISASLIRKWRGLESPRRLCWRLCVQTAGLMLTSKPLRLGFILRFRLSHVGKQRPCWNSRAAVRATFEMQQRFCLVRGRSVDKRCTVDSNFVRGASLLGTGLETGVFFLKVSGISGELLNDAPAFSVPVWGSIVPVCSRFPWYSPGHIHLVRSPELALHSGSAPPVPTLMEGPLEGHLTQEACSAIGVLIFVRQELQTFRDSSEIWRGKNPLSEPFFFFF